MPQITAFLFQVDTYVTHVYNKQAMITGIIHAYFCRVNSHYYVLQLLFYSLNYFFFYCLITK